MLKVRVDSSSIVQGTNSKNTIIIIIIIIIIINPVWLRPVSLLQLWLHWS